MTMTVTVNSEKQANGAFEQAGGGTGIRVILADSQAIYRVGMKKVFALEDDIRVVAQAETLANLHTALQRYPTDVVVLEGQLIDRLIAAIPPPCLRLHATVTSIPPNSNRTPTAGSRQPDHETSSSNRCLWTISTFNSARQHTSETFDAIFLATPLDATRRLLAPLDRDAAYLLPRESSSAVLVAFAYTDAGRVPLPPGFGFLVPPRGGVIPTEGGAFAAEVEEPPHFAFEESAASSAPSLLLACTFVDQKFSHRVPPNGRLVRVFFGGTAADRIDRC